MNATTITAMRLYTELADKYRVPWGTEDVQAVLEFDPKVIMVSRYRDDGRYTIDLHDSTDAAATAAVDDFETHTPISVWDLEAGVSYEVEFSASMVKPSPISAVVR